MVIARINNFLCGVFSLLGWFVWLATTMLINGEIQLNQIRKETLAINYENEDMQHRLDIFAIFLNVDKQVTKTKILQTAKQVMELSAANLPNVNYENKKCFSCSRLVYGILIFYKGSIRFGQKINTEILIRESAVCSFVFCLLLSF